MSRRLMLLFAVTAGVAVGNLYWAQPLLDLIASDLNASQAGWSPPPSSATRRASC